MLIETRIKGIPAMVRVHYAKYSSPDFNADNDIDYYGGWDMDYTICDRNGRPAPWLEAKLNQQDLDNIEAEIMEKMGESETV